MLNKISEIQIVPIKPNNGLVGFASFVYDGCIFLGSIGIYTRPSGGYRLTYPTRKGNTEDFNIFYPINKEIANVIEEVIIAKFEKVTNMYDRHDQISTR